MLASQRTSGCGKSDRAMKGTLMRHHDDVLEEAMSSPPADIGVLGGGKTSACGGIRSQWSLRSFPSRDSTVP